MLLKGTGAVATSLIYLERRRLFNVFPDNLKVIWKRWEVELLIILSLILQFLLITLGHRRKYLGQKPWVRFIIWSAYLLADWVATVALGVISQNTLDNDDDHGCGAHKKDDGLLDELKCFWAPFLLLHLGGPDTITAYALEDNELWLRHFVGLLIQSGLAFYILLVAMPGSSWLPLLSFSILIAGLIKYGERTLSLRSANIEHLRDSMLTDPDPGPNYAKFMEEFTLKEAEGYYVQADEVKELPVLADHSYPSDKRKLIPEAFDRFQTFKRLFVDLILSFQDRDSSKSYFQDIEPEEAFDVVEVELGFAFDILYTKAPVVYSVRGCFMRFITLFCTCFGLIAFMLLCNKSTYHNADLAVTYSLLASAIILEMYAVIQQINSDWMDCWLHKRGKTRDWFHKNGTKPHDFLIATCLHQPNTPRWSGCMSQYNLLGFCLKQTPVFCYRFQKFLLIDQLLEKYFYNTYQGVSYDLKVLIFKQLQRCSRANDSMVSYKARASFAFEEHVPDWTTKLEFDQSILIWHIATDICYSLEWGDNPLYIIANSKQSKHLSDYMLYLMVLHPLMLPIGIGMIRFRDTCAEAREFFKGKRLDRGKANACKRLLQVNTEVPPVKVKGDRSKSVLFDAVRLAKWLQLRTREDKWEKISHVWVEMLAYAATHCRGNHHAQQLRKGGELLTHVWLLMAHLGITEQFQINQGHARAKLVAKQSNLAAIKIMGSKYMKLLPSCFYVTI